MCPFSVKVLLKLVKELLVVRVSVGTDGVCALVKTLARASVFAIIESAKILVL